MNWIKELNVRNDIMSFVIKHCRDGRSKRSIDRFRKKVTTECVISECSEYDVKSKIGNIFVNEKIRKEQCVKIYEIDSCFYEHYENKNKSWSKWI